MWHDSGRNSNSEILPLEADQVRLILVRVQTL